MKSQTRSPETAAFGQSNTSSDAARSRRNVSSASNSARAQALGGGRNPAGRQPADWPLGGMDAAAAMGLKTEDQATGPAEGIGGNVTAPEGASPEPPQSPQVWGTQLASHRGVPAYSNGGVNNWDFAPAWAYLEYGYEFQCVEYANRFAAQVLGTGNMKGSGHASAYVGKNIGGLTWIPNVPGPALPQDGDILVFTGGNFGHIGICTSGSSQGVGMIHQNWGDNGLKTLGVSGTEGSWKVSGLSGYPLAGWHSSAEGVALPDLSWNRSKLIELFAGPLELGEADGAWAEAEKRGIIEGGQPESPVTRAEVAKILNVGLGLSQRLGLSDPPDPQATIPFAESSGAPWWASHAAFCRAAGLLRGGPDNHLRPNDPLTKDEATLLLERIGAIRKLSPEEQISAAGLTEDPRVAASTVTGPEAGVAACFDTPPPAADTTELKSAMQDLGDVDSLDAGFFSTAGQVLDFLVPDVGDKGSLVLAANVPVVGADAGKAGASAKIGLRFEGDVAQNEKGIEVGFAAAFVAIGEVKAWIMEAFIRATVGSFVRASGDSGAESMRLVVLSIQHAVESISKRAADMVFDDSFKNGVVRDMDEDDYVEYGAIASVDGGLSFETGKDEGVAGAAGFEVGLGHHLESEGGKLTDSETAFANYSASMDTGDPLGELSGDLSYNETDGQGWELGVSVGRKLTSSGEALGSAILDQHFWLGVVGKAASMVQGHSGHLSGNPARAAGSLSGMLLDVTGVELAGNPAWTKMFLGDFGDILEIGLAVELSAKATDKGKLELEGRVDRTTTLEFGTGKDPSDRDKLYAEVEKSDNILLISI
jgi:hypothetical protein